jgi:hypothetical protein
MFCYYSSSFSRLQPDCHSQFTDVSRKFVALVFPVLLRSLALSFTEIMWIHFKKGARDGAVVEALRYKLESSGIDSRWCHWNFSLT